MAMSDRSRNAKSWFKILSWGIIVFFLLVIVVFLLESEDQADFFFALGAMFVVGIWTLAFGKRLPGRREPSRYWVSILAGLFVVALFSLARHLWSRAFDGHRLSLNMVLAFSATLVPIVVCSHLAIAFAKALLFLRRRDEDRDRQERSPQPQTKRVGVGDCVMQAIISVVLLQSTGSLAIHMLSQDVAEGVFALLGIIVPWTWVLVFDTSRPRATDGEASPSWWPSSLMPIIVILPGLVAARFAWWLLSQKASPLE